MAYHSHKIEYLMQRASKWDQLGAEREKRGEDVKAIKNNSRALTLYLKALELEEQKPEFQSEERRGERRILMEKTRSILALSKAALGEVYH